MILTPLLLLVLSKICLIIVEVSWSNSSNIESQTLTVLLSVISMFDVSLTSMFDATIQCSCLVQKWLTCFDMENSSICLEEV